jgi:hypothetical protein
MSKSELSAIEEQDGCALPRPYDLLWTLILPWSRSEAFVSQP